MKEQTAQKSIEKTIYSPWAFTENESAKGRRNSEIYGELKGKYRIFRSDTRISLTDGQDCNFMDYDIVIGRQPGYHHALYRIYKNAPGLTQNELALICDGGNLCFGYGMQGEFIRVSED